MITGRLKARTMRMLSKHNSRDGGIFSTKETDTRRFDGTKDPEERNFQLERKTFSIRIEYFGNTRTVKITERGKRGYRAWLDSHPQMIEWLKKVIDNMLEEDSGDDKWKERVGEDVYLAQVQNNNEGMYLRVSRFRNNAEDKPYSLCFPCGESYHCWYVLSQVLQHFVSPSLTGSRNSIGSLRSVAEYPNLTKKELKGVLKVSKNIGWGRISTLVKRRFG